MTDTALLRTIVKPRNRPATDEELALFTATCERTGLDPLARQIYAQFRTDSRTSQEQMAIQATIDGFRVVAERSGDYLGGDAPQWCGPDGVWRDVWLEGQPAAARITVHKSVHGQVGDTTAVAHWKEYAPTGPAAQMWTKMPALMLAKVAEALALRRAFPMVLSGIYTSEEMAQVAPERIPDPEAPIEPPVVTDPDYVEALKAACKEGQLNWGKIKECYMAAGLTPPDAFDARFSALDAEQAAALLAAIENRQIANETDVPYSAAEVAPAAPTDDSDVLLPPPSARSGDLEDGQPAGASEDAAAPEPTPEEALVGAVRERIEAIMEPTPLPVGEAPVDALLAAAEKEARGEDLTPEERELLENGEQVVADAMGDPTPETDLTEADLLLLSAFVKGRGLVGRTATELGTPPALARAAVLDLKQRVGLKTNVALLEWAERRLAA